MRKIFSLLTAILFAGSMMATDYQLVNSTADLVAGAKYVIGSADATSAVFMGTKANNNNRVQTPAVDIANNKIVYQDTILKLELGGSEGHWTFTTLNYHGTDGYLSNANSGTTNALYVQADAREFTISFDGNKAVITSTGGNERKIMRYNSGSKCFACYGSGQKDIYLYKEVAGGGEEQEDTYTVAGIEALCGSNWDPADTNNDMVKQQDGTYKWEKADVTLSEGAAEFKVVKNHEWGENGVNAYPAQNYQLAIAEDGVYSVTIIFNPAAEENKISAEAVKTGGAEIEHTYTVAGSNADLFGTAWDPALEANDMDLQQDGTYKWEKADVELEAGEIELKVVKDHDWNVASYPAQNYILNIEEAGVYTITVTFDPANDNAVNAVAQKTGGDDPQPQTKDIQVVPGAWADYKLAAWAWEGLAEGAWYPVVAKNEQMIAEVPAAADHIIIVAFETTAEEFDWNTKIAQTSNQDIDACGVIYINNGTPTWCQPAEIVAEDYTVAGDNLTLFGISWDPTNTANDMVLQEDGTYKWEKSEVTLASGNIKFKVVKDHSWDIAYPAEDYILNIAEDGEYTVTIIFNPAALGDKITANAQKTGEAVVVKNYLVVGQPMIANGEDWNNDADVNLMTTDDGGLTYTLVVTGAQLIANEEIDYRYKIVEKGSWTEYFPNTGDDAHLFVNQDGVYTLTYQYTVETKECVVMTQRTADLPEPTLTNGYYIIGKFAGVEDWTVAGLTEAHRFILQNETEEGAFYQLTNVPLAVGDSFKVVQVYHDLIVRTWPEGSTEGAVIDANHAGEAKTIYLSFLTTGQWYCNVEPNIYDGYYLVGNIGGVETWTPVAANRFSVTDEEGEFLLHYTLAENDRIKVGYAYNGVITSWYPDGTGNEYTVDANHAGEKDIYFRPIYRAEWQEFGGHIWMGSNEPTAISNTAVDAKAEKILRNGMILIIKGDKTYNVMGQIVK